MPEIHWLAAQLVQTIPYTCGYCGNVVASDKGWEGIEHRNARAFIRVCPQCQEPTYLRNGVQVPGAAYGEPVQYLPVAIGQLYNEARAATQVNAYTAAVMICRKVVSNVAVELGAEQGLPFGTYVGWLETSGHIPPKGRLWVDRIREKGNEANHEIAPMGKADAEQMITFLGMLLRIVFEFPKQLSTAQD